jgi:hypothetical protein
MITISASRSNSYIGRVELYQEYKKLMLLRIRGRAGHISSKISSINEAKKRNSIGLEQELHELRINPVSSSYSTSI